MYPYSTQLIQEDDVLAISEALRSPLLTQGNLTPAFERALCDFCHAKYALVFNSATSALYSAYKALGLEDSEVITTPISFVATSNMLLQVGARPVFCDVKEDGNIDEGKIIPLITPRTKAIVSIDFGGKSVEVDSLVQIAREYGLRFISDSSHAIGGYYKDSPIGGLADASIFSFHPLKPMTTLEGGALLTNDEEIYEYAKLIGSHGVVREELWHYDVVQNGFNFRMNEVQASLGISQLKKLPSFLQRREQIAVFYDGIFADNPYFTTLHQHHLYPSSNHLYPILLFPYLRAKKPQIFAALRDAGLGVQVHYRPIYQFSYYRKHYAGLSCPSAEEFYDAEISIPCHQKMSLGDAELVAQKIFEVFEKFS
ncbi:DegT family aminotransferase [Helicobacter mustelae]|uniref:UDP-4-amino-4, 6-dideoxy-N-acetyl-beta-L-altrosamine transaminase n=1 Tax=Helicobacter mustelae TaxID=217 RepID=UPI000E05ED67|nr:UDP-4-amino-4,6-dideoxy-N-acetyl-beta-L-altrosamine transaminase [Helicobacter mustelae]STP12140.1 DegT family aminotransferase [Helicobacter mustelae]